jgi:hypothetical protein
MTFGQDPFDQPPHTAHRRHGGTKRAGERHHGGQHRPRHQGVVHHPHSHHLGTSPGLHHPHQHALAGTHHAHGHGSGTGHGHHGDRAHAGQHRSRAHLEARAGLQRIEVGTLQSYNPAANTATVRLLGAQANLIGPLPLAEGIAPSLAVTGATCLVVLLDEANPQDAVIVALYNAPPGAWTQAGSASLVLTGYQLAGTVSFPIPFANTVPAVVASSRDPAFVASVSGESLSSFVLTLTRREGATQLQAGTANIAVGSGAGTGSATVTFPVAFAVARTVVASAASPSWATSVSAPSATGATLTVTGLGGAVGPVTITVHWQATGDPAVSATVAVDWVAVGT